MALEKPFEIVSGLVEPAKRIKDIEAKFGKIHAFGLGGMINEERFCYSVSWKQAYNDPYHYRFSVVAMKIYKMDMCKMKVGYRPDAKWENIICAGSVNTNALYHGADFGSPLLCLFLFLEPHPNPSKYGPKNKKKWIPIVSGIAMQQQISDPMEQQISDPVLYTKIAPFNQFAREQGQEWAQEWIMTQQGSMGKDKAQDRSSKEMVRAQHIFEITICFIIFLFSYSDFY